MNVAQNKLADAYALHEKGDLAKAERQYRALLRAAPKHPDLLYLMGMLCLDTERSSMAAGFMDRAIRAAEAEGRKVDLEWRLAHGTAIQRDGDQEGALAIFERVHADEPKSVDALFCKGTALQALERLDEATEAYKTLLDLDPHHAEAAYNIGVTLRDAKNSEIAIIALRKAVLLKPDYIDALRALANLLEDSGWREDAVAIFRKLSQMLPEDIAIQVATSRVLIHTGRVDEAETLLIPLLEKHPDHPMLVNQLSSLRLYQGNQDEATRLAKKALEINPKLPASHLSLTMAERNAGDRERIAEMEALLEETEHGEDALVALHFGLAGRYGSLKEYEVSLDHYLKGNAAKRKVLDDKGVTYKRDAEETITTRIIETSPRETFDGPTGSDSELPVFIVGMPRSGTSLTEQILASHPLIGGAGELTDMGNAAKRMRDVLGYPRNPPTETSLQRVARMYLKRLREVDARALRVTDKMPKPFRRRGSFTAAATRSTIACPA
jgi:tetratricopeptide (TPR) repeat protein